MFVLYAVVFKASFELGLIRGVWSKGRTSICELAVRPV